MAYNFSSYFDKKAMHDSIYGDTLGNFMNQVGTAVTNFMAQSAQQRMEEEQYKRQMDNQYSMTQFQLGLQDKENQFKIDMDTYKRELAISDNNFNFWRDTQFGGNEGQDGIFNQFGRDDQGTLAYQRYGQFWEDVKGAWDAGLASQWGFKSKEEWDRYLNDVVMPQKGMYDLMMDNAKVLDVKNTSLKNFEGNINTLTIQETDYGKFLLGIEESMKTYNIDGFDAKPYIIAGTQKFFNNAYAKDSQSAMTHAGYMTEDEFVEFEKDKANQIVAQITNFANENGIAYNDMDISSIVGFTDKDVVDTTARTIYRNVRGAIIGQAEASYGEAKMLVDNTTGWIDENTIFKSLGMIDENGNPNPNCPQLVFDFYDTNIGQMIFKKNTAYVTGQVLGDDINYASMRDYALDPKKTKDIDRSMKVVSLDGDNPIVMARDASGESVFDSYENGLVQKDGVYTSYKSINFDVVGKMLVDFGKFKSVEDIPNNVLIATTMMYDEALNTVNEDTKWAMWEYATSPYRKEEEMISLLNDMSVNGMFPTSKDGRRFTVEEGRQKWKSVPSEVSEFMNTDYYKKTLNEAMKGFDGITSNVDKFIYDFNQAFIDRCKSGYSDSEGTISRKDIENIFEDMKNNYTGRYKTTLVTENEINDIFSVLDAITSGSDIPVYEGSSTAKEEISLMLNNKSPYRWDDVSVMANHISQGNVDSAIKYISEELNRDLNLSGNDMLEITSKKDLINLTKDKDSNVAKQASFYVRELGYAMEAGGASKNLVDTFVGDTNQPYVTFYTNKGQQGIYIPASGKYNSRIFVAENNESGGTYTAYTRFPQSFNYKFMQEIGHNSKSDIVSLDELITTNTVRKTIHNNMPIHKINTKILAPSSSAYGSELSEGEKTDIIVKDKEKKWIEENDKHYRINQCLEYLSFMENEVTGQKGNVSNTSRISAKTFGI